MKIIFAIGAILIAIWQIVVSKQYFDSIKKQLSPVILALIALIFSLIFAAVLLIWGVKTLIGF
ncbi:hypothetical protein [Companilactobacillus futsaii]|uniref:hypothetical protein n=1 Tax=Companilactobacillus futsaii TaxID=938155 RepID=UPI00189C5F32|nr:hypothetical protein [Companilactobacillus futsaii]